MSRRFDLKKRGDLAAAAAGLLLGLVFAFAPASEERAAVRAFSELPVLHEGRLKPADTVARSMLLQLRGKQSVRDGRRRLEPAEWLLDAAAVPERADRYPVFRLDDPELKAAIGLAEKEVRYFSFEELGPGIQRLARFAEQAERIESAERTRVQAAALNLFNRLILYQRLKSTLRPSGLERLSEEAASPETLHQGGRLAVWKLMSEAAIFRPLPPPSGEVPDQWTSIGGALLTAHGTGLHPALMPAAELGDAWRRGDPDAFARAVGRQSEAVSALAPKAARRAKLEAAFNRAKPFILGMALYLAAGLLVIFSWIAGAPGLGAAARAALAAAVAVHTAGLVLRMLLEGRPPVTNLYSSAIFVGWVGAAAGLWQERRAGGGLAAAAASVLGFCTLIVAHHLAQGDTMEMMRAVLDSNFWLGTHVVTITMGYGGTFLAGTLAHVYLLRGILTPSLDKPSAQRLVKMTYFTVCISLFFSFVGTVLGGIWADQSWGRFWGWDPKENGALMIVLWLAMLLHARWGGFVRDRGVMAMAVFGNVVTALSWFGVNMLGIGLHSYGFMESALFWLGAFCAVELGVIALAMLPPEKWKSRQIFA